MPLPKHGIPFQRATEEKTKALATPRYHSIEGLGIMSTATHTLACIAITTLAGSATAQQTCCGSATCDQETEHTTAVPVVFNEITLKGYEGLVADSISKATYASLSPEHQQRIIRFINTYADTTPAEWGMPPAFCFAAGSGPKLLNAMEEVMDILFPQRFQTTGRWSGNVASGSAGDNGEPITLTWSFVPDGTFVPSGVGEPAAPSNLFERMDFIYNGDTAAWQDIYFEMFDRWEAISGLNFVYEPNDDGADMFSSPGVSGVRGDLRMAGKPIDGNSGTLAYNFFPNNGDMVVDTDDNFYLTTSNDSQRLYNILKHEHGHGMGLLHVCPVQNAILMEPFINLNFEGAQHDDIRGAHRLYGDFFEPNDSIENATDLGALSIGGAINVGDLPDDGRFSVDFGSRASLNIASDVDVYRFEITQRAGLNVLVTPIGTTYLDNPQNQACTGTNSVNSLVSSNLRLEVLDNSGTTISSIDATAAGLSESLNNVQLNQPGVYYIRVSGTLVFDEVQLYDLDFSLVTDGLPILISSDSIPTSVQPFTETPITVTIDPGDETIVPGSPLMFFRANPDEGFFSLPLQPTGSNNQFTATLPIFDCGDEPSVYFRAIGSTFGETFFPTGGADNPASFFIGELNIVADSNFETADGWTVDQSTASDGQWSRGVPVDSERGDPPADFDGSGQCWLTDNVAGNSDVDDGFTRIISPVFDITGGAVVSWAYWLNDIPGGEIGAEDFLRVEFSSDGGANWQTVANYTTVQANWRTDSIEVNAADASNNFQVRVTASETAPGDVLEAGFDAFAISSLICEIPTDPCEGDANGDRVVDIEDLLLVLREFGVSTNGDVDNDGDTDIEDLLLVLREFGADCR